MLDCGGNHMSDDDVAALRAMQLEVLALVRGLTKMFDEDAVYRFGPATVEELMRVYVNLRMMSHGER